MDLSTTEQELYDLIKASDGVTVEQIKKELGAKYVGAIGKLNKIGKIKKEKRRVGKEGYAVKLTPYYVVIKEENEIKN